MATREVYFVTDKNLVKKYMIDFKWSSGFAKSQKQKCIKSLHEEFNKTVGVSFEKIIEISSKSERQLGINLSAFNLRGIQNYSVESAFQSSKVFENGGPYTEILNFTSLDAKRDPRLKNSGVLKYFIFLENKFELNTGTAFYDWLYINVLLQNTELCEKIINFRAFTDIEFNSKKSKNTQAFSIALYVALKLANVDMSDFKNPKIFLEKTKDFYEKETLFDF